MSLLSGLKLVVIDLETTGFSPAYGHSVLEVARVTIEDGAIAECWSSLVGPPRTIAADAVNVHGITEAMLADAPDIGGVAKTLREPCGQSPIVFHHAAFDLPFLSELLRRGGQPPLYNPVIDTLGLARVYFSAGNNSLPGLAVHFGLEPERWHRALPDARTTARLLLALAPRWESERGIRTIDELAAASQDQLRGAARRADGGRNVSDPAPLPAI